MGEYAHTIDAKGRVILPADFRQELGLSFVITKGLDKCLFLYGQQAWEELAAKLRALPLAKPEARAIVPANLRAYADITLRQSVVLTGADNRIEVWSKDQWSRYNEEVEPDVTAIAASLAELGM